MRKYLAILLLLCIPGCLVPTPFDSVKTPESKAVAKEVTALDTDMAKALENNTLEEHAALYKVFKGASEYAKNAKNLDLIQSVEVKSAMSSVMKLYDVYDKFKIKSIVEPKTRVLTMPAGLLDTVTRLKELERAQEKPLSASEIDTVYSGFTDGTTVREILIKTYDDLADSVKYSAEHLKGK